MYGPNMLQTLLQLVHQVHHMVSQQHEQLRRIESELAAMRLQFTNRESSPSSHVEKIEYNFEQLKVDTLEGTLVIGVSPTDTGTIAQWALQQKNGEDEVLGSQGNAHQTQTGVQEELEEYIRGTVPQMLEQISEQSEVSLTEENKQAIVEDMLRQIGSRIAHYSASNLHKQTAMNAPVVHELKQTLQNDIHAAIHAYIEHFRKEQHKDD